MPRNTNCRDLRTSARASLHFLVLERITKQEILENPCFLLRDRCQVSPLIFSEFKQIDELLFPQKSLENLFFHDFSGSLILAAKFGDDLVCKVENSNLIRDFRKPLTYLINYTISENKRECFLSKLCSLFSSKLWLEFMKKVLLLISLTC